jgi:hypothetical protein
MLTINFLLGKRPWELVAIWPELDIPCDAWALIREWVLAWGLRHCHSGNVNSCIKKMSYFWT